VNGPVSGPAAADPAVAAGTRFGDEDGLLATPVLFVVWCGLLVAIAVIDVGAYLVAAGRAQAAADAAALAAVSLDVEPASTPPLQAARTVAHRNRGDLESCTCRLGSGRSEVQVSVAVHGLFIPRVTGAQRVTATARAELADVTRTAAARPPPPTS
jgi:hypothetical protein